MTREIEQKRQNLNRVVFITTLDLQHRANRKNEFQGCIMDEPTTWVHDQFDIDAAVALTIGVDVRDDGMNG